MSPVCHVGIPKSGGAGASLELEGQVFNLVSLTTPYRVQLNPEWVEMGLAQRTWAGMGEERGWVEWPTGARDHPPLTPAHLSLPGQVGS